MNSLCKIYLFVYLLYLLFGYDCVSKLINNENPKIINNDICLKRFLQLSLITLLINALFFNTGLNITLFIVALLLNIIVCVGYFIKFYPIKDPLTLWFHVLWAIPIFFVPMFCTFNGKFNEYILVLVITLLILYKFILEEYVYS